MTFELNHDILAGASYPDQPKEVSERLAQQGWDSLVEQLTATQPKAFIFISSSLDDPETFRLCALGSPADLYAMLVSAFDMCFKVRQAPMGGIDDC